MSIKKLFDHRAVIHRPSIGSVDANGDPTSGWSLPTTPPGLNARPDQSWTGGLGVSPIGPQQAAMRIWYLDKRFVVEERDILEIVSGPESGNSYRIHSVTRPTAPQVVHHIEVATMIYEGALT